MNYVWTIIEYKLCEFSDYNIYNAQTYLYSYSINRVMSTFQNIGFSMNHNLNSLHEQHKLLELLFTIVRHMWSFHYHVYKAQT